MERLVKFDFNWDANLGLQDEGFVRVSFSNNQQGKGKIQYKENVI